MSPYSVKSHQPRPGKRGSGTTRGSGQDPRAVTGRGLPRSTSVAACTSGGILGERAGKGGGGTTGGSGQGPADSSDGVTYVSTHALIHA